MSSPQEHQETLYETLKIRPNANSAEILQAYREMKFTFQSGSLAAYSLYSEEELSEIITRVDKAYFILSHPDKRAAYDVEIGIRAPAPTKEPVIEKEPPVIAEKPKEKPEKVEKVAVPVKAEPAKQASEAETVQPKKSILKRNYDALLASTNLSGATLKKIRESQDLTIHDIADRTKISLQYIEAIENEDESNFPAPVYLKSFIKQYAVAIHLDPELVLRAYSALHKHENQ